MAGPGNRRIPWATDNPHEDRRDNAMAMDGGHSHPLLLKCWIMRPVDARSSTGLYSGHGAKLEVLGLIACI